MKTPHIARQLTISLGILLIASCAAVQKEKAGTYQPQVGQSGKDVVWVPTPQALVDKMLDMAQITTEDFVIDLGSGDGRTVITAAKRGVRALGVEFNPDMVKLSRENAQKEGVAGKAAFIRADLFKTDLSQATVITMFLLSSINLKLRPKILDLKPGTRIVSNTFTMGDWEADETATVNAGDSSYNTALLWIVPAKVEGLWKIQQGELELRREYQKFSGTMKLNNTITPLSDCRLRGDQISFSVGGSHYAGKVKADAMEGSVSSGGYNSLWHATRAGKRVTPAAPSRETLH